MPVVEMTRASDAAGAVPADMDVAVIMQRKLSHEQCLSSDSVLVMVAMEGLSRFSLIFRAPPGFPRVERQFFGDLDDEEFFAIEGSHAN